MTLSEFGRKFKIWHPTYGYYGGASKKWCEYPDPKPTPIDEMDSAFRSHDIARFNSKALPPKERAEIDIRTDRVLGLRLRSNLEPFKHRVYGPIYCFIAKRVFKV